MFVPHGHAGLISFWTALGGGLFGDRQLLCCSFWLLSCCTLPTERLGQLGFSKATRCGPVRCRWSMWRKNPAVYSPLDHVRRNRAHTHRFAPPSTVVRMIPPGKRFAFVAPPPPAPSPVTLSSNHIRRPWRFCMNTAYFVPYFSWCVVNLRPSLDTVRTSSRVPMCATT